MMLFNEFHVYLIDVLVISLNKEPTVSKET
jgi:hypothetical protein